MALVSRFDGDIQILQGAVGVPEPWLSGRKFPRVYSLCRRVLEGGVPSVLNDISANSELRDHPALHELKFFAHLALPLFDSSRGVVGAVAVADHRLRNWSEEEVSTLADIARSVEAEIAVHASLARAERAERALQLKDKAAAEALDRMDEGFYSLDRSWRLIYVNRSAERFWRKRRRSLLGKTMFDLFPRFRGSQSHTAHETAMRAGKTVRVRAISTATGTPVELNIYPSADGLAVYFRDVSAEERIEAELRSRGEVLTLAEESAGIGIWDLEIQTGLVRGTPQYFRIMGLEPQDTVPIDEVRKIRHPADGNSVVRGYEAVIASGANTYDSEYRILRNGETRWIFGRGRVVRNAEGKPIRYSGIDIDITERKRAEEALKRNDERLRIALTAARMFAWEQDIGSGAILMSENVSQILGSADPFVERMHRKDRVRFAAAIARTSASGEPCDAEYRFRPPSGDGWLWLNVKAVRVEDGVTLQPRLVGVAIDVTERVKQFRALAESEARFRTTADSAPAFIWMADEAGKLTFLNRPFAEYVGLENAAGSGLPALVHPEDSDEARHVVQDAIVRHGAFSLQARFLRRDGVWRWFRSEALARLGPDGALLGFTGCSVDVTEAREAEAVLRSANLSLREQVKIEAADKLQALKDRERFWNLSQDLFAVISNVDGKPRIINTQAWERILGYPADDLMQTRFVSLIHPDDLPKTMAAAETLRTGKVIFGLENRYRHADGSWRWLSWNVINDADLSYAVARDVTAERGREEALRRSQKLEALGQLTGGVAHDFNNLLMVIIGSLDLFQKRNLGGKVDRLIGAALSAARRGERLNRQLLGFARRQAVHQEFVRPSAVIEEMLPLIRGALTEAVGMTIGPRTSDAGCLADAAQLEAAVLNLVVNSRDAMSGRGELRIEVREAEAREIQKAGLADRPHLAIEVTDNGAGMSEEVLSHAFEPFFTTKGVGQGTGLGLAQVYGFARQFNGSVDIRSTPGAGTSVTIYLPIAAELPPGSSDVIEGARGSKAVRVLLVEDDTLVGAVTEDMLRELGHNVTRTESADAAVPVLNEEPFDLLITDVRMPGRLNGVELAKLAVRDNRKIKVLLCSGWTAEVLGSELSDAHWPILPKPFSVKQLADAIASALGASAPATN